MKSDLRGKFVIVVYSKGGSNICCCSSSCCFSRSGSRGGMCVVSGGFARFLSVVIGEWVLIYGALRRVIVSEGGTGPVHHETILSEASNVGSGRTV